MRTFISVILCFAFHFTQAQKQTINIDSLTSLHLGKYSIQTGNSVAIPNSNAIAFFEMQFLDSVEREQKYLFKELEFFSPPAMTLFQLLQFDEKKQSYQKTTLDTLDINLGSSTCHMANRVDSAAVLTQGNVTSLILLICHPVAATCSSMTYYYLKSYDISSENNLLLFENKEIKQAYLNCWKNNWRENVFENI